MRFGTAITTSPVYATLSRRRCDTRPGSTLMSAYRSHRTHDRCGSVYAASARAVGESFREGARCWNFVRPASTATRRCRPMRSTLAFVRMNARSARRASKRSVTCVRTAVAGSFRDRSGLRGTGRATTFLAWTRRAPKSGIGRSIRWPTPGFPNSSGRFRRRIDSAAKDFRSGVLYRDARLTGQAHAGHEPHRAYAGVLETARGYENEIESASGVMTKAATKSMASVKSGMATTTWLTCRYPLT